MVGTWRSDDDDTTVRIERAEWRSYRLTVETPRDSTTLTGHLTRVGDAQVLDVMPATGVDVAQTSLWVGVDDLDGTVQEERIYHMAGARTPETMSTTAIRQLIRAAGREPVERDTLYNEVRRWQ